MAEFSRGCDEEMGESFGQRRPPLYEMIKNILREYPSGQIFKVSPLESILYMPAWLSLNCAIILTRVRFNCICQFNTAVATSLSTV